MQPARNACTILPRRVTRYYSTAQSANLARNTPLTNCNEYKCDWLTPILVIWNWLA
jgi:hypothetical protein